MGCGPLELVPEVPVDPVLGDCGEGREQMTERASWREALRDANHWIAGFFERCNCCILPLVRFVRELQIRENAIVPIKFRRALPLPIYGDDGFPLFAGGLGQELLKPCAQV